MSKYKNRKENFGIIYSVKYREKKKDARRMKVKADKKKIRIRLV